LGDALEREKNPYLEHTNQLVCCESEEGEGASRLEHKTCRGEEESDPRRSQICCEKKGIPAISKTMPTTVLFFVPISCSLCLSFFPQAPKVTTSHCYKSTEGEAIWDVDECTKEVLKDHT